jgi:hypothetical protein
MASTLVRQVPTDDDGTGTVGTVLDAAYWAAHYNSIENTFALSTSFTPTWGNTGTANTHRAAPGRDEIANPNRAPNRQPPDV